MYGDQRWTYVDFWGHAFTDARYAHRRVSYSDRKEFVEKSVEFMFARLQPSVDAFRRGISPVFDGCEGGYLQGRDLMEMVVGVGDVDVEELQKATQYEGYECDDQVIVWFWEILKEIAARYQRQLEGYFGGDMNRVSRMAIIWGGEVRMANLCIAGSMAVNGVSALHSEILRKDLFKDACQMMPDKFKNVTNGIDHRRWVPQINPGLDGLLRDLIGEGYLTHPQELKKLEAYAGDKAVLQRLEDIKHQNKLAFAAFARKHQGVVLNTDAIFDVQVKRLHEYKRQLLNALQIIYLYQRLQDDPSLNLPPQTFLFGAKAAPGYAVAKRIIHLINSLADQINSDPLCKDRLQVVFLENYRVSLAEVLMPASEVSQQISTAGKEASGTGNMKFMMNGALTVGTLDGANVEMHDLLGDDNMFLFGLHADEVEHLRHTYDPNLLYHRDPVLRRVLDQLKMGFRDGVTYEDLFQRLVTGMDGQADQYMVLADFAAYCEAESRMRHTYRDRETWNRMSLTNIARSGVFAADRAISQYADTIWHVPYKQ